MFTIKLQDIARPFINLILFLADIYKLFLSAAKFFLYLRKAPVRTVFFKQIYFTGIEALNSVVIIGVLIGLVIIIQVSNIIGLGSGERTVKILIWIVVRELGPLLTAIIILARSGTAIAAELGSMQVGHEIRSLEIMGISPLAYLIMPRILGVTLAVVILTFYFELLSIVGGLGVASLLRDIALWEHVKIFISTLTPLDMMVSLIKSLIFGSLISTIACHQGFIVGQTITQIPQAATKAVIQSIFMVFLFDGIITLLVYL